jgi:hypothetical protein
MTLQRGMNKSKKKKITLQYKCRRCEKRYFDPTLDFFIDVKQINQSPSLMTTIHFCDDQGDGKTKDRFGIADLIGCKVEMVAPQQEERK